MHSYHILVVIVLISSGEADKDAKITQYGDTIMNDHGYNFFFETSNGIERYEKATNRRTKPEDEPIIFVEGVYQYVGDDGKEYMVSYQADDKGYRPKIRVINAEERMTSTEPNPIKKIILDDRIGSNVLATLAG